MNEFRTFVRTKLLHFGGPSLRKGIQEFPGGLVVKDLMMSLLWLGYRPWSRSFWILWAGPKKKKKKKEKKKKKKKKKKRERKKKEK